MRKIVSVGTWGRNTGENGITLFVYDEKNGDLEKLQTYDQYVSAGAQFYDAERRILYVCDECEGKPGDTGGGGFIRAYAFDPEKEELRLINERCTLMGKPAYVWMTPEGDYLLVANHTSRNAVTKVTHDSQGNLVSCVVYDDAGVTLIHLNDNGSLDKVSDVSIHQGLTKARNQLHSHPHSVVGSPDGSVYYVCDKGLDKVYSYAVDHDGGKLIPLAITPMNFESAPRYSTFHPRLPVWYMNNETDSSLIAFEYDSRTGALREISRVYLYDAGEEGNQSDLVIDREGRAIYASIRGINKICVLDVQNDGSLSLREKTDVEVSPRGLCLSDDGKYLYVAGPDVGAVVCYKIIDGSPVYIGKKADLHHAANICFLV